MNDIQLNSFVILAKTLNYTKTAEQLYISQTAVTKQIQKLEEELNVQLFERTNKKVVLTEAGLFFYQEALAILEQKNNAIQRLESFRRGEAGILKIGYMKTMRIQSLFQYIYEFQKKYPQIQIELQSDRIQNLYHMLEEGVLDVVVCTDLPKYSFEKTLLHSYRVVEIMGKDFTGSGVIYDCRDDKLTEDVRIEEILMNVACNKGIAYVHEYVVDDFLREYVHVKVIENDCLDIYVMKNKNVPHQIANTFIQEMQEMHLQDSNLK